MIVHLITEGHLEEPVGQRLIAHCGHQCGRIIPLRGSGNVQTKAHGYMPLAKQGDMVLVLTDFMDTKCPCPPAAVEKYMQGKKREARFLLRFAEAELESWLLADSENMADFLGIMSNKISGKPDDLIDPKRELVNLASVSKKKGIRAALVPRAGGGVGPEYNARLAEFVRNRWDIDKAAQHSPSLARCVRRLCDGG